MKGDDVGRARLDASRKRKASSQTFEQDAPLMPGCKTGSWDQVKSTSHGSVEITAAHGSGDPDQAKDG